MDVWSTNVKDLNKLPHIMKDNYEKLEEEVPEVFAIVTHEYSKKSLLRRCKRLKIEGFAVKDDISIATGKLVDIRLGDMSTRLFFLGDKALPDVKGFLWSLDGHLQKKSA